MVELIEISTAKQGLCDITREVQSVVTQAGVEMGLCTVFVQHTSASLTIQENADPSARHDLEQFLNRLVPESDPLYTHTMEGIDDMPAHIKSVLTSTTLSIPVADNCLLLGTWQGIYLWEHRHCGGERRIAVHVG
ncbi:MAG: secondary thiamine-phosphate synthase enzyme YjbQ [Acidiferrobacterales bacterium]